MNAIRSVLASCGERCVEIKEPFMLVRARVKSEPVGSLRACLNVIEGSSPVASAR